MTESRRLDLVVVGGGPAGLAAAEAAAGHGRQVLLVDQAPRLGGQIWRHRDGDPLPRVARDLMRAARPPRVSLALGASVVDAPSPDRLVVDFGGRVATVDTDAVVLATGAMERFLPFPGWTLPGVVGVGALQALLKSGTPIAGARVVIAGTGPLIWPVAEAVVRAGGVLELIAEQAGFSAVVGFGAGLLARPGLIGRAIGYRRATWRTPFRTGRWPLRAEGGGRLQTVIMGGGGAREVRIDADWLATAAGLIPRTDLGRLLGCRLDGDALAVDAAQATSVPGVWAAGECTGVSGDDGARIEGTIAGLAAIGITELPATLLRRRTRTRNFGVRLARTFAPRAELRDRVEDSTMVCRCEDVRAGALDPAWEFRQAKLWTRIGMGACQARVCGSACSFLYGWDANTVRPPLEQPQLGGWARAIMASPTRDEPPDPHAPPKK